jgi:hypothetical protein
MVIEEFVARTEDATLVQAARSAAEKADPDWAEVCGSGQSGLSSPIATRDRLPRVYLNLGDQPDSRLTVVRHYYGAERVREGGSLTRWQGASQGLLNQIMEPQLVLMRRH